MKDEKKLRKFKLLDREGFINEYISFNTAIVMYHCKDSIVEGYVASDKSLDVGHSIKNITVDELSKFFEEVHDLKGIVDVNITWSESSTIYWDGNDTDDIEVGMVVSSVILNKQLTVEFIKGDILVVSDEQDIIKITTKSKVVTSLPSEKEQAFTKFIDAWRKQGLEYAHDHIDNSCVVGMAFNVFYETFLEEK